MDNNELIQELVRFNNSSVVKSLQDTYSSKSFFDILEITRDENGHSHVIKWLFSLNNLPCGWQHYPIMNFLDLVIQNAQKQKIYIDKKLADSILLREVMVSVENIELEKSTTGVTATNYKGEQSKGRIDIFIECNVKFKDEDQEKIQKLKICIENKVDSSEHDSQTWKYFAYLAGKDAIKEKGFKEEEKKGKKEENITTYSKIIDENGTELKICYNRKSYNYNQNDEIQLFVFLTPQKNEQVSCPNFVIVTYQELMDSVLVKLSKQENLLPKDKLFLEEYMNALSIPFVDEKNNKEMPILAIREEDEMRLCDFYEENRRLIKEIIQDYFKIGDDKNKKYETFWKINNRFVKNALSAYVNVEKRKTTSKAKEPTEAEILLGITKRNANRPSWIWIEKDGSCNKYETLIDAVKVIVSFLLKVKCGNINDVNKYLYDNNVRVNPQPVLLIQYSKKKRSRYTCLIDDNGKSCYVSTQWGAKDPQKDNFFKLVNTVNNDCNLDIHVWTDVQALDILDEMKK